MNVLKKTAVHCCRLWRLNLKNFCVYLHLLWESGSAVQCWSQTLSLEPCHPSFSQSGASEQRQIFWLSAFLKSGQNAPITHGFFASLWKIFTAVNRKSNFLLVSRAGYPIHLCSSLFYICNLHCCYTWDHKSIFSPLLLLVTVFPFSWNIWISIAIYIIALLLGGNLV